MTIPSVPPYSSTTIARCWFSRRISLSAVSTPAVPGQPLDLAGQVADGRGAAGRVVGQEQVADVHEADDVVLVPAGDREARPVGVGDLLGRPAGGHRRVEEGDLGARGHHLADLALAGAEDLVDQPPLVAGQRLVRGDQVAQLLLADRLAADLRVAAEQPHQRVRRRRQQPDDRPGQGGQPVQRRGDEHRQALGPLQRQPLGGQLAEDQGQVADHDGHADERQRSGQARAHAPADQDRGERLVQGLGTEGGRREARPG